MDIDELLKLDRPLTSEEMAFTEQRILELAKEFRAEIESITKDLGLDNPDVMRLRQSLPAITSNIEKAVTCSVDNRVYESRRDRRRRMRAGPSE